MIFYPNGPQEETKTRLGRAQSTEQIMYVIKDYLSGIHSRGKRESERKPQRCGGKLIQGEAHIIGRRGGIRDGVLEDETDGRWLMMNTTR